MEPTMVIYRVEHEATGLGPYTHGACSMDRHYCNDEYCPALDMDGIEKYSFHDAHYGFKSKKDLVRWFSIEYVRMFSYKKLYVYALRIADDWVDKGYRHLGFESCEAFRIRRVYTWELV